MATETQIRRWLERGEADGATHMLVVCDTFDWDDYPVYRAVADPEQLKQEVSTYSQSHAMQKVMEVYKLDMDIDDQLNERRAFNY